MTDIATSSNWRADNAMWLGLSLEHLRLQLSRRALWLNRPLVEGLRPADWLLTAQGAERERQFFAGHAAAASIDKLLAEQGARLNAHEACMREASRPPALRVLAESVGLSPFEEKLLLLAAAPSLDGAFGRGFCELQDDPRRAYATLHLALSVFVDDPVERVLAADCLMPTRPLRLLRLLDVDDAEAEPILTRRLMIDERIADFIRGVNRVDVRLAPFLTEVRAGLSSAAIERAAERAAEAIAADDTRWTTVNLLGSVSGGAREVAARACARLDTGLSAVKVVGLGPLPPAERAAILALLGREALIGGYALLIDADGIEPRSATAALVDEMITRVAATLFVVSGERWPTEHGMHVLPVVKPTRVEQCALWRTALEGRVHTVNGEIETIVQQFDFGPPAIAAAVSRADSSGADKISGADLWRSCREQSSHDLDSLAQRIAPCYGWGDIVVPDEVRAQLRELASQVMQRGRVYEAWGFGAKLGRGRGITALFSGPSGTGKTMSAEVLANELDLDLYRIDLAGVVSKYIGETEKNLQRVFDAAERSGAILFFDEADALFGTRTEVRDSHDRYANVEINYLLQRMEDYKGLAILATNRRAALDGAFMRRLRFVIEFPFPGAADRRRIWEQVFPERAETHGIEYAFLSRLDLTGGNIRSIAVNAAFLAAAERAAIGMPHVMRAAAREYTKLARPVNAADFGSYLSMVRS